MVCRPTIEGSTIVAVATPSGTGGIGIVRLSGPDSISLARTLFRSAPPLGTRPRYVEYGRILDKTGAELDSGLAWVLMGPRSYTGEDTVEISAHGSAMVLNNVVEAAIAGGATLARPGEFTRRAFVNGRMDLLQAEGVIDLIQAGSKHALQNSYGHTNGRLSQLVETLKDHVVRALALLEVKLDFSQEEDGDVGSEQIVQELEAAISLSHRLLETFAGSRRRQQGYSVALIGRPNVGKSTLFNALLGEDRAIVTHTPGTTRDVIEGQVVWGGDLVRLRDTAGIRAASGAAEVAGMERTRQEANDADLVLIVTDYSRPWSEADKQLLTLPADNSFLIVRNKFDKPCKQRIPVEISEAVSTVLTSAYTGTGVWDLRSAIMEHLPQTREIEGVGLTRQRHVNLVEQIHSACQTASDVLAAEEMVECVAAELHNALSHCGELLGENVDEAVLDEIFSEFCIGK